MLLYPLSIVLNMLLTSYAPHNADTGFEGFLDLNRRVRRTPIKPEDRFFSSSSVTGTRHLQQPAAQQQQQPPSVQPPEGSQA